MTLDDIHRLLDTTEDSIVQLADEDREFIEPTEAGELCLVIGEIMGWGSVYASSFPMAIGVSKTTLTRFLRLNGRVSVQESRAIADRIRAYLRALDQRSDEATEFARPRTEARPNAQPSVQFKTSAIEWRVVEKRSELKAKIAAVSAILDGIIQQTVHSNCPESEQALTQIERQQLIAVLETAINILKAPMVERGLLTTARDMLWKTATEAGKKGVQKGIEEAANTGVAWLNELISFLF